MIPFMKQRTDHAGGEGLFPSAPHLALGKAGEDAAAVFMARKGARLLDRNWRPEGPHRGLELDMVALDGETVIFVEVKTRSRQGGGVKTAPADASTVDDAPDGIPVYAAFTPKKQRSMARAARLYLSAHDLWERPCRFDLICAERLADGRLALEHFTDVIELGHIVDSGHTAWQPW